MVTPPEVPMTLRTALDPNIGNLPDLFGSA
jgi:hypothetical protein